MSIAAEGLFIGGQPIVTLTRPATHRPDQAQFLEAAVIPGKGMNLWQIKAYIPGQGNINLLHAAALPSLAQQLLDDSEDPFSNHGFTEGGAILLPYANRIRGSFNPSTQEIETRIAGKKVSLPANWQGKLANAEKHAMHGLLLNTAFTELELHDDPEESRVIAALQADNFNGHWLSETAVTVKIQLRDTSLTMTVTAANIGNELLPMGIGWHPYFSLPSNQRQQARLHLPAVSRVAVNNYDDVFPSGQLLPLKDTAYDFSAADGRALGEHYLDDCFVDLQRDPEGTVVTEIMDPAVGYGLRINALSPEIKAIQVYAPADKNFIAIEPQFNLADPYNSNWGEIDTGMVLLEPARSVSWRIRLEILNVNNCKPRA